MARLKTKADTTVRLSEEDYEILVRDRLMLRALIIAGIEEMPVYQAMQSILNDRNVYLNISPIKDIRKTDRAKRANRDTENKPFI